MLSLEERTGVEEVVERASGSLSLSIRDLLLGEITRDVSSEQPAVSALAKCLAAEDEQFATQAALALNTIVVTVVSESLAGLAGRPRRVWRSEPPRR